MLGSVLEERVRGTWNRVVERFEAEQMPLVRTTSATQPADLRASWTTCVAAVRELFVAHHGSVDVAERFRVPEEYAAFMQAVGGGWKSPHGLEWILFEAESVVRATANDFRLFVTEVEDGEPVLDTGFWLSIGWYSDKHEYLLCCDRTHSYYGVVVDGHDSHPWMNGIEFAGCWRMAGSFPAWLEMHSKPAEPSRAPSSGDS